MEGKKTDLNELSEKVLQGLKKALKELVEASARNNEDLIIGDKDGNISSVPAKELLHSVQTNR
jgi:hypothetical protein